jgi:hypothetical protein
MKKLTASLGDTLGTLRTTASAVSAAAATQINRTLGDARPGGGGGGGAPPPLQEGDKQYLRLPVDSARKLRWYDKGDAAALTRQHVREKHVLLDTITALKKVRARGPAAAAGGRRRARPTQGAAAAQGAPGCCMSRGCTPSPPHPSPATCGCPAPPHPRPPPRAPDHDTQRVH